MVDLFNEVDEELRSDRFLKLLQRFAPWATAVLALVLVGYLGFWGYTAYQDRNLTAAAIGYQKGVDALGTGDSKGALDGFEAAKKAGSPGYKALALMQEGALRAEANKPEEAAKLFDQAAEAAPNQIIGDVARLRAAQVLLDTAPLPQLQTRLTPLMDAKRPYAVFARETLAMARLMAGKNADARKDFNVLQLSLSAPDDMRQRAQLAIALIDSGEASTAVAAVKAAATMPPPPVSMVGPPPASQGQDAAQSPPAGAAQ